MPLLPYKTSRMRKEALIGCLLVACGGESFTVDSPRPIDPPDTAVGLEAGSGDSAAPEEGSTGADGETAADGGTDAGADSGSLDAGFDSNLGMLDSSTDTSEAGSSPDACTPLTVTEACAGATCGVQYDGCGYGVEHLLNCGTSPGGKYCTITPQACGYVDGGTAHVDCSLGLGCPLNSECAWMGVQGEWCCL